VAYLGMWNREKDETRVLIKPLGDDPAEELDLGDESGSVPTLYMRFKDEVVAKLPDAWAITCHQIERWLDDIEKEAAPAP
jgi:hypothetical protein